MASEQFSLCWDNFHKNMSSGMNSLLENEDLVDVTLAVEGKYLKAHKMVLSVCSPYFKELFKTNPCKHPIVFMKDVSYIALSDLLQFMYQGEVQVSQENLTTFIKTAEALQIKGLTGDGNGAADNDLDSDEKSVQIVEDYKPTPQVSRSRKVQQPPTTTPSPAPKRQRLISAATSEVSTASTQPVTKTEPVASNSSDIVQFKMEPYDQTQPGAMQEESVDEAFGDESLDVTAAGDTEDYSMMEGNDEEPQAGTSAEGTGEGQGFSKGFSKEFKTGLKMPAYFDKFLRVWGLEAYIKDFLDEDITDESFRLIDEDTINAIFKKNGPKLIFKRNFKDYLDQGNDEIEQIPTDDTMPNCDMISVTDSKILDLKDLLFENNIVNMETTSVGFDVPPLHVFKKSLFLDDSSKMQKKIKLPLNVFEPHSLEDILKKTTEGRVLISRRNRLGNNNRQHLVQIIMNHLINKGDTYLTVTTSTLSRASEQIAEYFPGESKETYFVPYSSTKGVRVPARGKLWSKYLNMRTSLRMLEVNPNIETTKSKNTDIVETHVEESINVEDDINFLKSSQEPFTKIREAWEKTRKYRINTFNKVPFNDLANAFPILKTQRGLELIESDFNHKYPKQLGIVYANWPMVAKAIVKEAKGRKTERITNYGDTVEALFLLPFLFSPITLKKSKKTNCIWRPSRTEVQESFFFELQSLDDLEDVLNRRKQKLKQYSLTLQPFGIKVGDTYYIIIDNIRYAVDSAIRFIELLYKIMHTTNLQYPAESRHIFILLECMVFEQNLSSSDQSGALSALISDLKYRIENP